MEELTACTGLVNKSIHVPSSDACQRNQPSAGRQHARRCQNRLKRSPGQLALDHVELDCGPQGDLVHTRLMRKALKT